MNHLERPVQRPLVWLGDSKKSIQSFPKGAQKLLGDELQLVQFGGMPEYPAIQRSRQRGY